MQGAEQLTRAVTFPVTRALSGEGRPGSVTSAAQQQIDNAFQTTTQVGDDVQRKTVDLIFDLLTLKPVLESLQERTGLGETPGAGFQSTPELDYLNTLLEAGPAQRSTLLLVMATLYANLNKQSEGIERFEYYLKKYSGQLSPPQRSVYLSCLALLRAGRAQQMSLLQLTTQLDLIRGTLADINEAKELTKNEPDFTPGAEKIIARWVSGLLQAQLPWPFGNKQIAREDLKWCEAAIKQSQEVFAATYQFLREVNYSLALVYRDAGEDDKARKYLELSGYESFDKKILTASLFSCDSAGFREGPKLFAETVVRDRIPGHLFTVSGFDMSEFNFIISEDGSELMAVDAGSRPDTTEAGYKFFEEHYLAKYGNKPLPKLTKVFITHTHWDHAGGHMFYRSLNPDVKFYSRSSYIEVRERSAKQPPPFKWFLGVAYRNENISEYQADVLVGKQDLGREIQLQVGDYQHKIFEMIVGGTRVQLILPHCGGGETRDGLIIYLPDYRVLHGGDFIVPWIGAPYVCEGDIDSLFGTIDMIAALDPQPQVLLYGHGLLSVSYGKVEILQKFKPHLQWLKEETLKQIYAFKDLPTIQEMNLVPPAILDPSQADVQLPYLIMREVVINRLFRQTVGYWGPQLQGVDHLSDNEFGAVFTEYLGLSDEDIAAMIDRMLRAGDHELAGKIIDWILTRRPNSKRLKQAQQAAFLKLKEKWQLIIPFKFLMYSEHINDTTRQVE